MAQTSTRKKVPPRRTAQSAEIAFQKLRKAILSGELREGTAVREIRLVREWKIGRTPLREAIRRAAESGYLVLRPNQAPLVRKLSAEDIRQIYDLREVLECFALECAWPNIGTADLAPIERLADKVKMTKKIPQLLRAQFAFDNALHQLWVGKCGNPWLISILERLFIFRPNYQSSDVSLLGDRPDLTEAAFEAHLAILAALGQRDLRRARLALKRHIKSAGQTLADLHETAFAETAKSVSVDTQDRPRRPGKSPVR